MASVGPLAADRSTPGGQSWASLLRKYTSPNPLFGGTLEKSALPLVRC
jgi:hypothetical protein